MQSVVHPVQTITIAAPTRRRPRWAPTVRLGVVASVLAVLVAVLVHLATPLPTAVIVAGLAIGAFALSWRASVTGAQRRR